MAAYLVVDWVMQQIHPLFADDIGGQPNQRLILAWHWLAAGAVGVILLILSLVPLPSR